jgi:uncharacterized repeat protein (TIGR03803 family)
MRNSPLSRLVTLAVLAVALGSVPFARGQYTETTIHNFTAGNDGAQPVSGMILDPQGNLYGTTTMGGPYGWGTVFRLSPPVAGGWTETELFDFTFGTDGGYPIGGLVMDTEGNLYGTTFYGGSTSCMEVSCGVVFKLAPRTHGRWKETVLHSFQNNARDGFFPESTLVFDSSGNLFGTTNKGGAYNLGVVFELTPITSGSWKEQILHSFTGATDGAGPYNGLIVDQAGNLYGTAPSGGNENTATCTNNGCGVVFKLTRTSNGRWNEHVLYSFTNTGDGTSPTSGLTVDAAGNLYGAAGGGTSTNCNSGPCGIVFELTKSSGGLWTEKVLYNFVGGNDGMFPESNVIFDAAGNLYGATYYGGDTTDCAPNGCGTVFKLSPSSSGSWTESALYSFTGGANGCTPNAPLAEDNAGNFYGTTQQSLVGCVGTGGASGAVFELTP